MGAVPISTAIIINSIKRRGSQGTRQFIVRRNVKTHGSGKKVEGYLIDPIVVDVMTKGSSVAHAIEAVRKEGYETAGVVLVIDREVPNNSIRSKVKSFSLFKHSDFSKFIDNRLEELH